MKKLRQEMLVSFSPPLKDAIDKGELDPDIFSNELVRVHEILRKSKKMPGRDRAKMANAVVDDILQKTFSNSKDIGTPTCQKGCSHCCYQEVLITYDEAALLISKKSEDINWAEVEMQSGVPYGELPHMARKCVFLKDDECSVYEDRPSACRKYFVTSDPELCNSKKHPKGDVEVIFAMRAELFSSSLMSLLDSGPMPKMLLDVKFKGNKK